MRSRQAIEDAVHTRLWLFKECLIRRQYDRCDVLLKELRDLRDEHEKTPESNITFVGLDEPASDLVTIEKNLKHEQPAAPLPDQL